MTSQMNRAARDFGPSSPTDDISWRPLAALLGAAIVLWLIYWAAMFFFQSDSAVRGQFGDMFGAVNALFSAFAFAGLIYAILLQRKDLQLQLRELRDTREELRGQKEQLEAQNKTFLRQSFETRFFEWLKLHHEIVNGIDIRSRAVGHGVTRSGRDCFGVFLGRVQGAYNSALRSMTPDSTRISGESETDYWQRFYSTAETSAIREVIVTAYLDAYRTFQGDVGHYFRNLYNLVKFVHRSTEIPDGEKRLYTSIVRAQLSSDELALLFYNCLSPYGSLKFKPLVEQYGLLKNMDLRLLFDASHKAYFHPRAYAGSDEP